MFLLPAILKITLRREQKAARARQVAPAHDVVETLDDHH
jgi:hypothetical protein